MVICKDESKILNPRRSIVTKHQWTIIPNHSHYKCSVNYKGRTHTHTHTTVSTSKFIGTWPLEYIVLAPFVKLSTIPCNTENTHPCMPTLCQFQKKIKKPAYNTYGRPGMQTQKKLEVSRPAGNEKTIKQLLGELYGDRQYLEKLLKETGRQH